MMFKKFVKRCHGKKRLAEAWRKLERKGFLHCYPKFFISGVIGHCYASNTLGFRPNEYTERGLKLIRQGNRLYSRFGGW